MLFRRVDRCGESQPLSPFACVVGKPDKSRLAPPSGHTVEFPLLCSRLGISAILDGLSLTGGLKSMLSKISIGSLWSFGLLVPRWQRLQKEINRLFQYLTSDIVSPPKLFSSRKSPA